MLKQGNIKFTKTTLKKVDSILESIETGMAISKACEKHRLNRTTFYKWIHDNEDNSKTLYDIVDSRTLEVEDALYNKAIGGDTTAQIFWLKNRASKRWRDQQEIKHDHNFNSDPFKEIRENAGIEDVEKDQ